MLWLTQHVSFLQPLCNSWRVGALVLPLQFWYWRWKLNCPIFKPSWRSHAKAVATSAACGLPIAIAGAIGFMWFGAKEHISVPNTIGYIHIYAFIGISVMSFVTAKLGAKVAHALSPQMLKNALLAC